MHKQESKVVELPQVNYLTELQQTKSLCDLLIKTPHYANMGPEGIFAIVETAKALDIDPRQALGGGLYFVKGRVEMSSRMMGALIRAQRHSITRDSKSDDTICILHGKRSDTKDCWTESFSMEEAKKAGLLEHFSPWITFPRDMLYARALSRLARQLFPDIIGNCYVQGEIAEDPNIPDAPAPSIVEDPRTVKEVEDPRTVKEVEELENVLDQLPEYCTEIKAFLQKRDITKFCDIPKSLYCKILERAKEKLSPEAQDD